MLEVQAQSRWSSVSEGNSPMFTFSDMKGALVFFAVLLSVLSGECVGSARAAANARLALLDSQIELLARCAAVKITFIACFVLIGILNVTLIIKKKHFQKICSFFKKMLNDTAVQTFLL